ncbi:MAG: methylated-DNA--[protein]-cysteine S-methyltransferase [Desulfobacterales bacterium]|nr:methylated-DNA--[protein]-cysteine S-methyltransferase [Desulfobacterales bacterium]
MDYSYMTCPFGHLLLESNYDTLERICFCHEKPNSSSANGDCSVLNETKKQLNDYFNRKRKQFSVKIRMNGTAFDQKVWSAIQTIPYGETMSYGIIAKIIGQPTAFRAVGRALGRNPLPIVIPCHRVIGKNGNLVGFSAGLNIKKQLIEHERCSI